MVALGCTLGVFAWILILARLRVPLAMAVVTGTVVEGALLARGALSGSGLDVGRAIESLPSVLRAMALGAVRPSTVALVVVTVLLVGLSRVMQSAGQMRRIVRLARRLLRRPAVAMIALPALIGLLPMPGGALFSAPMVETAAGKSHSKPSMLSAVNYWFRHIWEHWWPLYPGVMLALTLTASDVWVFIPFQIPLGVFMLVSGLWIFRGSHPSLRGSGRKPPRGTGRRLLQLTSSIWVILLVWGVVTVTVRLIPTGGVPEVLRPVLQRYLPLTLGLVVSLCWTVRLNRLTGREIRHVFTRLSLYQLGLLVLSVMVFQAVLHTVQAAPRIGEELTALHVPVVLVVAALPFIAGAVTGLAVGFVGTSFPIVLGLVETMPDVQSMRPFIALAYAFGHLGQMMSPMHLCHVVSNRYFKTGFAPVYRYLIPPAFGTAVLTVAYFCLLRWWLG